MNAIPQLLALLLTLQTEKVEHPALQQLLAHLQLSQIDWDGVQEKVAVILGDNPALHSVYTHFKTQLDQESEILALLPQIKLSEQPAMRGEALPGKPDEITTEIVNIAVTILKDEHPAEKAKKLLKPLNDKLKPLDRQ